MIYAAIGIPLTLVFLSDLSLLITRLIKYLSLILLRVYSMKCFLHIRQWIIFRFIEKQLNISIPIPSEDEEIFSSELKKPTTLKTFNDYLNNDQTVQRQTGKFQSIKNFNSMIHIRHVIHLLIDTIKEINDNVDLTMPQLLITLFFYILIGACLVSSGSYFDGIYICFTSLFSINLRDFYHQTTTSHQHTARLLFFIGIYLLFGIAIVSICVKAVQFRIQLSLENLGKKILLDLVEFLRQMGKSIKNKCFINYSFSILSRFP